MTARSAKALASGVFIGRRELQLCVDETRPFAFHEEIDRPLAAVGEEKVLPGRRAVRFMKLR